MEAGGRESCDLVMKGGIASGVVYPGAVIELARRYRFRNLGGASAGAIAAAVAAAGEYGRQLSGSEELPGLEDAASELSEPGFVPKLLRPEPGARPAFELMLELRQHKRGPRAALSALAVLLRSAPAPVLLAAVAGAGVAALALTGLGAPSGAAAVAVAIASGLAIAIVLIAVAVGGSAWLVGRRLARALRENGYGMCRGAELADWLHRKIQVCAGRGEDDPPLTFRDLEQQGIRLAMVTTDLSYARPVRLPLADEAYLFDPRDLQRLFPDSVLRALGAEGERVQYLPGADMPIVVAVRLSLSFPLLLSAVRLRSPHPARPVLMENWFSDGGISSNFPIHFFDSWLPRHPTFGLDLQPFPDEEVERGAPDVFMPTRPDEPLYPHWTRVTGVGRFIRQVSDVMENWRDTMQAELPGFRDRVCQVRMREGEGGLNVGMGNETVEQLIDRGRRAAREIEQKFDLRNHRFTRYLTLMQLMETGLHEAAERFGPLADDLAAGMEGGEVYREGHDAAWCRAAERATGGLLDVASGWGPPPAELGFDRGVEPMPKPVLRVTPEA